jgi:hypothetical protein
MHGRLGISGATNRLKDKLPFIRAIATRRSICMTGMAVSMLTVSKSSGRSPPGGVLLTLVG